MLTRKKLISDIVSRSKSGLISKDIFLKKLIFSFLVENQTKNEDHVFFSVLFQTKMEKKRTRTRKKASTFLFELIKT